MTKHTLFFAALILLVSCGSGKTAQTKEEPSGTVTEEVKTDTPGQVTTPGAEAGTDSPKSTQPAPAENESKPAKPTLHGSWELEKVYGAKEPFKMLFPGKIPTLTFDQRSSTLNGNNGCNQYNGPFTLRNGVLGIGDLMATKMFCEGVKEQLYMTTLKMANGYTFEADKLVLTLDGEGLMAFRPIK